MSYLTLQAGGMPLYVRGKSLRASGKPYPLQEGEKYHLANKNAQLEKVPHPSYKKLQSIQNQLCASKCG